MDWNDPQLVCDTLTTLQALPIDSAQSKNLITMPHEILDFPGDDIHLRTLAGFVHLKRISDDTEGLYQQLESLLKTDHIDRSTRIWIRSEIKRIENLQQGEAQAEIDHLINADPVEFRDTAPSTNTVLTARHQTEADDTITIRFGYKLCDVQLMNSDISIIAEMATLLKALTRTVNAWKDRLSLGIEADFIWRYLNDNHHVRLVLLLDVHAPEAEMAMKVSEGLELTLRHHLPLPQIYQFKPISDHEGLEIVSKTESFASVAEIVRQEISLQHANQTLYAVYPLLVDKDRLHNLMKYLRDSSDNNIVDISIRSTSITNDEIDAAMQMVTLGVDLNSQEDYSIQLDTENIEINKEMQDTFSEYRSMLRQLRQQAYEVRVRVASAENEDILPLATVAGQSLLGLSAFEIIPVPYRDKRVGLYDATPMTLAPEILSRFRRLWSIWETAMVGRLPQTTLSGIPGLPFTRLKRRSVPMNLPVSGCMLGQTISDHHISPPVYLPYSERTRHVYMVGRTGTGKTTLLHNMALQDIENGHGVGVIDPHGDLIETLLSRIPPDRARDVVVFDPSDLSRPLGLNLLDVEGVMAQNMAVADFIGLMYSMYDPRHTGIVGPRFEQSVRNSMYTAMSLPGATLIDVLRIIGDEKYSRNVRKNLQDVVIKDYWDTIYESQSSFHQSEVKDYITSKFSRFIADRMVRQIIGQPKTSLDFANIFDSKKILLVNLAKGRIGEFNSQFLGFVLVSQLLIAAFQRTNQVFEQRTPFYLYLDEFQNFATPGLASMLSEGRKYGLALTLAHQFTHQLEPWMREAVFGNIGTICNFQVGIQDALYLSPEMYPVFGSDDLVNLPSYHVAVKLLTKEQTLMPFAFKTMPERRIPSLKIAEAIKSFSRLTYGRNATVVEDQIRDQFTMPLQQRLDENIS